MAMATVRASSKAAGRYVFPRFPMWAFREGVMRRQLGKYSTIRKNSRLLSELQNHLASQVTGNKSAIAMDYFDMLNRYLLQPLSQNDVKGTIERMDSYCVSRSDLVEVLNGVKVGDAKSRFDLLPAKVKSAFTRAYNSQTHGGVNVFADDSSMFKRVTKGKKGKREATKEIVEEEDEEESEDAFLEYCSVCCRGYGVFSYQTKKESKTVQCSVIILDYQGASKILVMT